MTNEQSAAQETLQSGVQAGVPPERGLQAARRLLRLRDFRLLLVGGGLPFPGFQVRNMAQAWLVLDSQGGSLLRAGLVNAFPGIAIIFFSLVAGSIVDRAERRSIMVWTKLVVAATAFLTAYLITSGQIQWWHLLPIGLVTGAMFALINPATQTFTLDLVGRERIVVSSAISTTIANAGAIIAPAAVGYLLAAGPAAAFYLLGGIYSVAFVASALIQTRSRPASTRTTSLLSDCREGLRYARTNRLIRWLLIMGGSSMFVGMFQSTVPVFARDVLDVGEVGYGALIALQGAGALAASLCLLVAGDFAGKGRTIILGSLAAAIAMAIFAFSEYVLLSFVAVLMFGVTVGIWAVLVPSALQRNTAPEMRGRVMSLFFIAALGMQIGWVFGGLLEGFIGLKGATVFAAGGAGIVAVAALVRSPELRRLS